jgi:hypothetical protein
MADIFGDRSRQLSAPARNAQAVTPSDSTDIPITDCRALYIGVGGNVSLITNGGQTVTFVGLQAGSILPVRCSRVRATDTTATNIVAIW